MCWEGLAVFSPTQRHLPRGHFVLIPRQEMVIQNLFGFMAALHNPFRANLWSMRCWSMCSCFGSLQFVSNIAGEHVAFRFLERSDGHVVFLRREKMSQVEQ